MEAIAELVGILVVISTTSLFAVLSLRNVLQDRPKAWRSAVQDTAEIVTRWAVWLAVVLTLAYALWSIHDRWGVLGIGLVLGAPLLLGAVAGVVLCLCYWRLLSERRLPRGGRTNS